MDGGFGEPQQPPVEGRHVDYAAENARKLAAGLGLGSVFDSLGAGSQRLKTSMGLPAQTEPATFRSEPSDLPGFSRDTLFPPAGIRSTEIVPDDPVNEATAAQQPHGGGSDAEKAAQNMHGAFAEATGGTHSAGHPGGFGATGATSDILGPAGSQGASATDRSAAQPVGPGQGFSQQGQGYGSAETTSTPAASLRDFLGHQPQGPSPVSASEQLPGVQTELKSHPLEEDYPTTPGEPSPTPSNTPQPSTGFEKPATQIGMPAFGGEEAPESQSAQPANSDALITLSHGIGQSPETSPEPKTRGKLPFPFTPDVQQSIQHMSS